MVTRESELNSLGRLLIEQGMKGEGLKILEVNAIIYPESSTTHYNLGEAYYKLGDEKNAALQLEKALEWNKEPQRVKEILKMLYKVKGIEM